MRNNFFLKLKFSTLGQRHFPDFSREENSKSSQIQMFPDASKLFLKNGKIWNFPDFSRVFQTLLFYFSPHMLQTTYFLMICWRYKTSGSLLSRYSICKLLNREISLENIFWYCLTNLELLSSDSSERLPIDQTPFETINSTEWYKTYLNPFQFSHNNKACLCSSFTKLFRVNLRCTKNHCQ